jgi:hypothetical protein
VCMCVSGGGDSVPSFFFVLFCLPESGLRNARRYIYISLSVADSLPNCVLHRLILK